MYAYTNKPHKAFHTMLDAHLKPIWHISCKRLRDTGKNFTNGVNSSVLEQWFYKQRMCRVTILQSEVDTMPKNSPYQKTFME